jgi:hypothetical protein
MIKVEEALRNKNIARIVLDHSVPGLEYTGRVLYDGSYVYVFRVYNRRRTEFFNVFAYTREEVTPCYSVRFSRVLKSNIA